jgi:hypothetical protein
MNSNENAKVGPRAEVLADATRAKTANSMKEGFPSRVAKPGHRDPLPGSMRMAAFRVAARASRVRPLAFA